MLDISKVDAHADVKITVSLTGAPVLKASYLSRDILPDFVALAYRLRLADGVASWQCVSARTGGHRVLKPAPDGSLRTGKDRHTADWTSYGPKDLAGPVGDRERPVPAWLVGLIDELRPAGYIEMPGS
ncbi:hypothetical protein SEA_XKCD426_65 [Streptomyces phage Xkcd426]|nr:hypothetical protein SEA_XKCD426_65 [Streptomyces phage Xkcd426]